MIQEKMTQEEIDALVNDRFSFDTIDDPIRRIVNADKVKFKYNAVCCCKERLEYARTNGTFEDARKAEINLHRAAFSYWLFKHGMDKDDYYKLMNKEAGKRGLREPFPIYI